MDDCLAEVRRCPRNAQCRLDLAHALEADGSHRRALAEAREATRLVQTYGRAWKTVKRLEDRLGHPQDDDGPYLTLEIEEDDEKLSVRADTDDQARMLAAERKARGNVYFGQAKYQEAADEYGVAMEVLRSRQLSDAKICSNRAACYLALDRPVMAASDALLAINADPQFWKGWWYRGQALLAVLKSSKHGPCSANAERAQEACKALDSCLASATLPAAKQPEVKAFRDHAQSKILEMVDQDGCVLQ